MQTPPLLLELYFLPPVSYMALLSKHKTVYIERQEQYHKGSYRNRFHIATSQGWRSLSIPLCRGKHEQMPIDRVRMAESGNWRELHRKSLQTAYGKAPYWEDYAPGLFALYERRHELLWDFCWEALVWLCRQLNINTELRTTERYLPAPAEGFDDRRSAFVPSAPHTSLSPYPQLFEERTGFLPDLSALDLLLCCGPEARGYL